MWLRFGFEYTAWGFAFRSGAAEAETVKLLSVGLGCLKKNGRFLALGSLGDYSGQFYFGA
jgi:hypothetical protein